MSRPRPSIEAIAEARAHFERHLNDLAAEDQKHVQTMIDALKPPTDIEIVERYQAFLDRRGWPDHGNSIWFADGVEAFIGRERGRR